jgi:nucleotide-binding universal stress UspA family protein
MPAPELRTVLAATDLGEGGEEVLRAAGALAAASGAALHVLHAFDFSPDPYPGLGSAPAGGFQERIREAELALDEQVRRAVPAGVEVAGRRVEIDTAARAILAYAEGMGVDLVVLGPHRRRGVADAILGSTADRVLRSARVPCLVAREALSFPLRRVVVPLDLSAPSRAALDAAFMLCRAFGEGAEVDVVHVIPRIFAGEDFPFSEATVGPELHREVEAALGPAADRAGMQVREVVLWGDSVPDEILRVAREWGAGLLVLGTHGRGGLERALLGSVAGSVARRADCPVLLVPPDEQA